MNHSPLRKLFLQKQFPIPSFLKMSAPGLELGTNGITYFSSKETKEGLLPDVFDYIPLEKECVVGTISDISECDEFIFALKTLAKRHKITQANITIPEEEVYVFSTTIFLEEGQSIEGALVSQIEKNVPFPPDDITYDYQIVKRKEGALIVSVAAASKKTMITYETMLQRAEITPIRAMSENQAMINSLLKKENSEPHIVVYVSRRRAVFSICERGVVELTSSITFPEGFNGEVSPENATINMIQKKISQILMHWYSAKGKEQHSKMHHMLVYTFNSDTTHDLVMFLKQFFPNLAFYSGTPWENMFDINDYLPEIKKDEAFMFVKAIGASLAGIKI